MRKELKVKLKRKLRINKNYPWLKFAMVIVIGFFAYVGAKGMVLGRSGEMVVVPQTPMKFQVAVPQKRFRGRLVGKKLVALTFDDGPSAITTPQLLDILRDKDAVATFFELGNMVRRNPAIVQRVIREGNELGSHTNSHQNLIKITRANLEADKAEADATFLEVIGRTPLITRPPYGNFNQAVMDVLGTPVILWSIDTRDWESKDPVKIKEIAIDKAEDGAILLFHDIYQTTIDSIPDIIDTLREKGFEFVTVSELAEERGIELKKGEYYYKIVAE